MKYEGVKINGIPVSLITEGDMYRLIVNSKLPNAEKFESWVFDEVIPTLRETGEYKNISTKNKYISEIDVSKAEMGLLDVTAKVLNLNDNSKLVLATNIYENYCIPTTYLPNYTSSKGVLLSLTELLKRNNIKISSQKVNKILLEKEIIKECTRPSTKDPNKKKKYKNLIDTRWGENQVNRNNSKETQPMYNVL